MIDSLLPFEFIPAHDYAVNATLLSYSHCDGCHVVVPARYRPIPQTDHPRLRNAAIMTPGQLHTTSYRPIWTRFRHVTSHYGLYMTSNLSTVLLRLHVRRFLVTPTTSLSTTTYIDSDPKYVRITRKLQIHPPAVTSQPLKVHVAGRSNTRRMQYNFHTPAPIQATIKTVQLTVIFTNII